MVTQQQDLQTCLNGLAQIVHRSAEIQQSNIDNQTRLQQTVHAQVDQQQQLQQQILDLKSTESRRH